MGFTLVVVVLVVAVGVGGWMGGWVGVGVGGMCYVEGLYLYPCIHPKLRLSLLELRLSAPQACVTP